ncbi:hypothetical protein COO91_00078 [Nostoc flagelliforme CCNUN1]|uniref:Uncharacterized protein n=1 Tax=Nostoc flagelliforme CCNUN1 TaxID=2038116 RepID=A0A2K8SFG4_9NOSO|nr:hypothetical protein COO91_00014 [Nostoc flagelliforme CCNUN1]AUB34265.1 hypothetical protein COO91_00078 [Nostoc flagelliforme CCNUN1]
MAATDSKPFRIVPEKVKGVDHASDIMSGKSLTIKLRF